MPHSHQDSVGSTDTFDLVAPMTATATSINKFNAGTAVAQVNPALKSNAWKHRSLPSSDSYTDLSTRPEFDELLQQRAKEAETKNLAPTANGTKNLIADVKSETEEGIRASIRERIQRESPLIAELRTNVIVKDEYTLVTDLSYYLAKRYARSTSAVMVKVDHSACLALGGSFDPCYILTVTNVPSQMGPALNKRNAALLQSFMTDILSVLPDRGIVKFHAVPEECIAINGTTVQSELERQEKRLSTGINPSRKSMPSFRSSNSQLDHLYQQHQSLTNGRTVSRRQSTATQSSQTNGYVSLASSHVYDIPFKSASDIQRPATSHDQTRPRQRDFGLPTNPVHADTPLPLKDHRLSNGRPKTFSAEAPLVLDHTTGTLQPQSTQPRQSSAQPARPERPPSFLGADPAAANGSSAGGKPSAAASSKHTAPTSLPNGTKPPSGSAASYWTTPSTLPAHLPAAAASTGNLGGGGGKANGTVMTPAEQAAALVAALDEPEPVVVPRRSRTANISSKRRSNTITATPKMSSSGAASASAVPAARPLQPPPIPSGETSSARSFRLSKRKSLLSMFRRSGAAAAG